MIKSDQERRTTQDLIEKFAHNLGELHERARGWKNKALVEAHQSQLAYLEAEAREYDRLKSTLQESDRADIVLDSLEELPRFLVKARIIMGLTQEQLAERLEWKQQQIQRYEATEYKGISFARLVKVAHAIGIEIRSVYAILERPE